MTREEKKKKRKEERKKKRRKKTEEKQTSKHYVLHCPRFTHVRQNTKFKLPANLLNITILLHSLSLSLLLLCCYVFIFIVCFTDAVFVHILL